MATAALCWQLADGVRRGGCAPRASRASAAQPGLRSAAGAGPPPAPPAGPAAAVAPAAAGWPTCQSRQTTPARPCVRSCRASATAGREGWTGQGLVQGKQVGEASSVGVQSKPSALPSPRALLRAWHTARRRHRLHPQVLAWPQRPVAAVGRSMAAAALPAECLMPPPAGAAGACRPACCPPGSLRLWRVMWGGLCPAAVPRRHARLSLGARDAPVCTSDATGAAGRGVGACRARICGRMSCRWRRRACWRPFGLGRQFRHPIGHWPMSGPILAYPDAQLLIYTDVCMACHTAPLSQPAVPRPRHCSDWPAPPTPPRHRRCLSAARTRSPRSAFLKVLINSERLSLASPQFLRQMWTAKARPRSTAGRRCRPPRVHRAIDRGTRALNFLHSCSAVDT